MQSVRRMALPGPGGGRHTCPSACIGWDRNANNEPGGTSMNERRDAEITKLRPRAHSIHIDNRMRISITGVSDVESFNEQDVMLITEAGPLNIVGTNLHLSKLNLEDGQISIEGEILALDYEPPEPERRGMFGRVFR